MEDAPSKSCVSFKGIAKFCLLYITSLMILLIIFTAFYSDEPLTDEQKRWWWAFVASLLFNTALCLSSLVVLIYTDYYRSNAEASGPPDVDVEQLNEASFKSPVAPQNSQSASYKTILTINSTPNQPEQTDRKNRTIKAGFEGFTNMTPQGQSKQGPITVVDLTKRQKTLGNVRQKTVNPIPSSVNRLDAPVSTLNKDKKKRKHGKDKNKNAKRKR